MLPVDALPDLPREQRSMSGLICAPADRYRLTPVELGVQPEIPFKKHCPELLSRAELQENPEHPIVHSHASAQEFMNKVVIFMAGSRS